MDASLASAVELAEKHVEACNVVGECVTCVVANGLLCVLAPTAVHDAEQQARKLIEPYLGPEYMGPSSPEIAQALCAATARGASKENDNWLGFLSVNPKARAAVLAALEKECANIEVQEALKRQVDGHG